MFSSISKAEQFGLPESFKFDTEPFSFLVFRASVRLIPFLSIAAPFRSTIAVTLMLIPCALNQLLREFSIFEKLCPTLPKPRIIRSISNHLCL
jgi:hypothetical protein